MKLPAEPFRLLKEALKESFSGDEMRSFLREQMGADPEDIIPDGKARDAAFSAVIAYFERRDRVTELVAKAVVERPDSDSLRRASGAIEVPEPSRKVDGRVEVTRERIVQGELRMLHMGHWVAGLTRAARAVGHLDAPGKIGTAFLVGGDLALTNYHVVDGLIDGARVAPGSKGVEPGSALPAVAGRDFLVVDDFLSPADGAPMVASKFDLAADTSWLVAASPLEALDFALVRLSQDAANQTVRESSIEGPRGFLRPAPDRSDALKVGETVILLHHPQGQRLRMTLGSVLDLDPATGSFRHSANTLVGSSGAPVFTADLQLVGLHYGSDARGNLARKMSAVVAACGGKLRGSG